MTWKLDARLETEARLSSILAKLPIGFGVCRRRVSSRASDLVSISIISKREAFVLRSPNTISFQI